MKPKPPVLSTASAQEPPIGPLMLDIEGLTLTAEDSELLSNPQVGGLILFQRNYSDPEQLTALVQAVRSVRPELVIAVDHEGGRVQRFREGFTRVPPMRRIGELYQQTPEQGLEYAHHAGWLIATELRAFDIDLSFAPVLDLDLGLSEVIGDRAFAAEVDALVPLAAAFIEGMHAGGMIATAKHFPGHGSVAVDSHTGIPVDPRPLAEIEARDLKPFAELAQLYDAVMPAHVIYSAVDSQPAGFSSFWIQQQLRQRLGFTGVVFSDDLSMEGAAVAGDCTRRAEAALKAGCDMILVCNQRSAAVQVLEYLQQAQLKPSSRLARLRHRAKPDNQSVKQPDTLTSSSQWQQAAAAMKSLTSS